MDEIHIDELKIFANHGVLPFENEKGQYFYVNAVLYLSTRKAGISDCLDDSVSYADVCMLIIKEMTEHTYKLIEAAAEHTALKILEQYELLRGVSLEIRKPDAPVDAEFSSVSVKIKRNRHKAYIAFGSSENYKEMSKEELIDKALKLIDEDPFCRIRERSSVMKSSPYGGVAKNEFLNGVICIETFYEPEELLTFLHETEKACGRERKEHWGDRTLDLDIIFYDDLVLRSSDLSIPHPDMENRDFVLKPLCEIAAEHIHPLIGKTVRDIYNDHF